MYYNKFLGRWIFDASDFFFISLFLGSILAKSLKHYLSEESCMARLRDDIIRNSPVIDPSKRINYNPKRSKIQRVYKFAINTRGGQDVDYQLAQQIQILVTKLAIFLKNQEAKRNAKIFKMLFVHGKLVLELILKSCKINFNYIVLDQVTQELGFIVWCVNRF